VAISRVAPEVSLLAVPPSASSAGSACRREPEDARERGQLARTRDKVWHFRRDVLSNAQVAELQSHIGELRAQLMAGEGPEKLKLSIESLEEVLRRTGGAIYPKSSLVENVDFFLVAAIVILGVRTYFVQPFKIPTNSMWPTYNGMTSEVWHKPEDAPKLPMQAVRFVLFGAQHKEVVAPMSGAVAVPVYRRGTGRDGKLYYDLVPAEGGWFSPRPIANTRFS